MADKKTQKQIRNQVNQIAQALGLGGAFADLVRHAVVQDWGENEFITRLVASDTFQTRFPGLTDKGGNLADFLTGQENATLSVTNLGTAIKNYNSLWESYQRASEGFQNITGRVSRDKLATLIKSQTSPEEFRSKLVAVDRETQHGDALNAFDQELRAFGQKPLSRKQRLQFLAGTADQKFYDIYEATRLRTLGGDLGFDRFEAKRIAGALPDVNEQGQAVRPDVGQLVAQLRTQVADIGPELQQAGISQMDLARFMADPTNDPLGIQQRIEAIAKNRRNQGGFVAGTQVRRGPGGGIATYEPEQPAAY